MFKRLYPFLIVFILFSCSNDEDTHNDNSGELPSEMFLYKIGVYEFNYNPDNSISSIIPKDPEKSSYFFKYENSKLINITTGNFFYKLIYDQYDNLIKYYRYTKYSYVNHALTDESAGELADEFIELVELYYNENIITLKKYRKNVIYSETEFTFSSIQKMFIENNNLKAFEIFRDEEENILDNRYKYVYGENKSPFFNVRNIEMIRIISMHPDFSTPILLNWENNLFVGHQNLVKVDEEYSNTKFTITYDYNGFNSESLPLKIQGYRELFEDNELIYSNGIGRQYNFDY